MLGKGLESLIPKKQYSDQSVTGQTNQNDTPTSDWDAVANNAPQREEREELGILSRITSTLPKEISVDNVEIVIDEFKEKKHIPEVSGPIFQIEVHRITLNPYQPRKEFDQEALEELSASIREFGILQPLVVLKIDEETDTGVQSKYQLIAGHRRLLAAQKAGLRTVPVVVKTALKPTEALELAIVENIQRENLNIVETARAYARLSDEFGLTQREIASRLGKSRESIANALRLLSLPTDIQESLSRGEINESHARLLLQIQDIPTQKELHAKILKENLSVREMKRAISHATETIKQRQNTSVESKHTHDDVQLKRLEKELSEFLGAPVRVEFSQNGGKIIIHFYSPEEALGIAQRIHPEE